MRGDFPKAIRWENGELWLLDQTRLPHEVVYEQQESAEQIHASIHALKVRGAPAIGIAAAYGLCVVLKPFIDLPRADFIAELQRQADYINSSRPTAVNLQWALQRLRSVADTAEGDSESLWQTLVIEAQAIHAEDEALCRGIGVHALPLIRDGVGVMTHCNAGALATGGIGTATAPLYLAHEQGISFRVFANETRPLLQGSRLTSWELHCAGIDVTLLTDNMAAQTMASGAVDLVIVGTDRVVANGDVANKIGTLGVAILAKHYGIPFYVACPSSTIDLSTADGTLIPIEQRDSSEVRRFGSHQATLSEIKTLNPAFDVTPAELVSGIITEKGLIKPPFSSGLAALFDR
ncbi:methylthioribose-1-phosphate isomerase [Litorivivens lipolytica]|uniref:Methylthioribose-1-phosphate isomerase n=1 Tax=Litorivivens lipolytica TaxID=1524264 RepID=A0A7W4W416_9GAMM|nr:S-methyl-5-thioribose-1-phosphate isomerase [Litorivivens lipolytica]MBB3046469.1 methylthioribose-1-phosphate isomerase [Litorivivens lipolytica]